MRFIRDRVRAQLRDNDSVKTFPTPALDQKIADAYIAMGADLPAPQSYTASAFTISAGSDTFTLPATVTGYTGNAGQAEYAGDIRIQLVSNGLFLVRQTREQVDAFRNGNVPTLYNVPAVYALHTLAAGTVSGLVYPGALAAEACNLFRSLALDDLRDYVGSGTDDLDDVSVQFSRIAATALVYHTAALLVAEMTPADLEKRRLNPNVAKVWMAHADAALYQAIANLHAVEGTGEFQEWSSTPSAP